MTEEQGPILVVFNAGWDHSFLGRIDNPENGEARSLQKDEDFIDDWEQQVQDVGRIRIFDCLPIGNRQVMTPEGPLVVPALGTMNWCILEPIRRLNAQVRWYYFPRNQGERSYKAFQEAYSNFFKDLETAKAKEAMEAANLQKATPEDLKRMEAAASKMGLGVGPDLLQALKSGGVLKK